MCGEDSYFNVFYACGAKGWISVIGNILPSYCQILHTSYINKVEVKAIQDMLHKAIDVLGFAGNPSAVKSVLNHLSLVKNVLRLPLSSVIIDADIIQPLKFAYEESSKQNHYCREPPKGDLIML